MRSEKFGALSATAGVAVFTYLRGAALTLTFEKCSDRRLLVKARSSETLLDRSIAHVRKDPSDVARHHSDGLVLCGIAL